VEKIGKYPVSHLLGTGATGEVWLGQHPNLDIPVAIKILSSSLVERDRNFVTRFINEARLAARLRHPNAVMIFDADSDGDRHFIVMEYISGGSVRDLIKVKGGLPLDQSLTIIAEVAAALDAAALLGIVHRDIKPDNIMLDGEGKARLADLGIAKQLGSDVSTTMTGVGLGTPLYLAPEQAYDAKNADSRSDLYSLGCTLFHMLAGKPPFDGPSAFAIMAQHANDAIPSVHQIRPEIPTEVDAFLLRATAKEPLARPQSASQFMTEILILDKTLRELAAHPPKPVKASKPVAPILLTACAVIAIVGLALYLNRSPKAPAIAQVPSQDAKAGSAPTSALPVSPPSLTPEPPPVLPIAQPPPVIKTPVIDTQPATVPAPPAPVVPPATTVKPPVVEIPIVVKPVVTPPVVAPPVVKPPVVAPPVVTPPVVTPPVVTPPVVTPPVVTPPVVARKLPVAKQNFQLPQAQIDMVYISSGSFQMGSKISETGRSTSEPLHEVRITEGFWLARTELSVKQFAVFIKATGYQTEAEKRGGSSVWLSRGKWKQKQPGARWNEAGDDLDLPVCHVSWNDAMRFCSWLNAEEKKAGVLPTSYAYSLPTEAQWEYAARAGSSGPWQGAARLADVAVGTSDFAAAKPGSKAANAWGLHDMLGNVWEWTLDASNGSDPLNPSLSALTEGIKDPVCRQGNRHVYRGGSWADGPEYLRCAMRAQSVYIDEAFSGNNYGFRLALIPAKLVPAP